MRDRGRLGPGKARTLRYQCYQLVPHYQGHAQTPLLSSYQSCFSVTEELMDTIFMSIYLGVEKLVPDEL